MREQGLIVQYNGYKQWFVVIVGLEVKSDSRF